MAKRIFSSLSVSLLVVVLTGFASAQQHLTGTLPDGAAYVIDVPAKWNGILLLYSHGYVVPGAANPAQNVGDPLTGLYLLSAGYALAGSSYATTGWAIHEAIPDQIATLDTFGSLVGTPKQTIAWGHSLGGMITAGLVQRFPHRFTAALPMCGVLAGGVGTWNQGLDAAFALNTLIASDALQIVHITNPVSAFLATEAVLAAAQTTAQGRARIALVSALGDLPGWFDPASPEPAPSDYAAREVNQFLWLQNVDIFFQTIGRAELEARAGGNPSWNVGVNYGRQLAHSADNAEVRALYAAAGLSLEDDLDTLENAARIQADPDAVSYLRKNIVYDGRLSIPVLTMHTTGDGLVVVEDEQAYKMTVRENDDSSLLREVFVHRAGHCEFTPAETLAAFQTLSERVQTGRWSGLAAAGLNSDAAALGPLNVLLLNGQVAPVAPAFLEFQPPVFLRPFDASSE
jgi:pimeloyl-ACP methyl ester carboxylesterase